MTKTKAQLRAEAVNRLTELNEHGYWRFPVHVALCGRDVPDVDEERTIIADLLTDDCDTECYECSRLAELVAENSQLRVKVGELTAELEREGQAWKASATSGGGKEREMIVNEWGGGKYAYYEEVDLAECRVCHVRPVYKDGTSSNGGSYVRCPGCGIKTGTSTSGLEGVLPAWNRLMVDGWADPKEAVE